MWRGALKISPPSRRQRLDFVHKPVSLSNKQRKCPEKLVRGCNSQSSTPGHRASEMLRVIAQQPIGFRRHGRDKHGYIGLMTNETPVGPHEVSIRIQNRFWICKIDQAMKVVDQSARFYDAHRRCMKTQVLLDLIADDVCQYETSDPGSAK